MTLDPQALTAAAEAEARYDGYDDLLSLSRGARDRFLDRTRAAITAYQAEASKKRISGAHKIAMAIRDIEEGNLAAVHFDGQTWRPEGRWQDISTAPKDDERRLVWSERGGHDIAYIMWVADDGSDAWFNGDVVIHQPTHWQPLPNPPASP